MFDFGIGASELLFIAIVALIVVGPKDLPRLLRTIGQYSRKIRGLAREFQTHLDEASKEAGLDDVKKEVKGMTNFTVTSDLDKQRKDLDKTGNDIKRAIEDTAPKNTAAPKKAPEPNSTTAVEGAIAESEKPKPDKAAAPVAAKDNGKAPAEGSKADAAGADKPKPSKPKPSKAAKAKPASKPKQDAGRSHETVK